MTVAYGIMDEQNVITIFIEAAVDLVGRYDRTKNVTSENYDKKLRIENSPVRPVTRSSPAEAG